MQRKKFIELSFLSALCALYSPLELMASPKKNDGYLSDNQNDLSDNINVRYIRQGNSSYESLRQGFNKRINKLPAVIALCSSAIGVAEAVKYAAKNNLAVAVKSGGHCMEGFSCNNDGLVINLSEMKSMRWINDDNIQVEPGCTLKDIYDFILPKNKIIPGGSCAGVGIGGLVMGGGYGLLARKFGLTCDSLREITMVDGTGKIIQAQSDSELLWACKGGNNGNFGIVTSLTFKVHHAPNSMQSFRFKSFQTTKEKSKEILKKWFEVTALLPANCFSAFVQNGKTAYILLTNVGATDEKVQKAITGLKSVTEKHTQTGQIPLSSALKVYYGQTTPLYFKNASAGLYNDFNTIAPFVDKILDLVLSTPGMIYQVNTLGGKIQDAEFEKLSSFPHRKFNYLSELQTYWKQPEQGKKLMQQFQKVQTIFKENGITAQYRNYPDVDFINAPQIYYGANFNKLVEIKKQYDPNNLFRYEQGIKV
ncbi:MAG: FAD-binding oxidoreductase [Ferruginibacter sp.]|nr:FAD-binding oxidoreductase [Ferruginibacter sp.]